MTGARGLDAADFATLFQPLGEAAGLLAAVSGGPDSVALMHGLALWRETGGRPPVSVATVDHGLRQGSREEAERVAALAARLGLPHRVLTWEGDKPATGLQEAARESRYALLAGEARRVGASHLVTAHTRSDQAETVLLRLAAGSGPAGLAAMRPLVTLGDGLVLARPLLACPKARLVATCREAGLSYVEDPSNADPRFARARLRRSAAVLAREGLSEERLARLAARLARDEDTLAALARDTLAAALRPDGLDASRLFAAPPALAERALAAAIAQRGARPRLERVEALAAAVRVAVNAGQPLVRSLGGLVVRLDRAGKLTFADEPPRRRGKASCASSVAGAPHSLGKGDAHA